MHWPPSARADLTREVDLIEEVARVVLDRVPNTMPLRRAVAGAYFRRLITDAKKASAPAWIEAIQASWLQVMGWLGASGPAALGSVLGWLVPLIWMVWGAVLLLMLLAATAGHFLVGRFARPAPPLSPNPALMTTIACTPFAMHSSTSRPPTPRPARAVAAAAVVPGQGRGSADGGEGP